MSLELVHIHMIRVADVTDRFIVDWPALIADIDAIQALPVHRDFPGKDVWHGEWGGWGVTTRDGTYQSAFGGPTDLVTPGSGFEDTKWTEIATPSMKDIINQVKRKGLYPSRARIAAHWPNSEGPWHIDGGGANPLYRLHFVITTNPAVRFETRDRSYHLELHRVYVFNTDYEHRILNRGDAIRYHLMMNLNMPRQVEKFCEGLWL